LGLLESAEAESSVETKGRAGEADKMLQSMPVQRFCGFYLVDVNQILVLVMVYLPLLRKVIVVL